jgi:hypothetical protein
MIPIILHSQAVGMQLALSKETKIHKMNQQQVSSFWVKWLDKQLTPVIYCLTGITGASMIYSLYQWRMENKYITSAWQWWAQFYFWIYDKNRKTC